MDAHIGEPLESVDVPGLLVAQDVLALVEVDARVQGPGRGADAPEIGPQVEGAQGVIGLLGRPIAVGPEADQQLPLLQHPPAHARGLSDAEIRQDESAVAVEEHVGGLHVQVQDRGAVSCAQGGEQVRHQPPGLLLVELPDHGPGVRQASGGEVLERREGRLAVHVPVVEAGDSRVLDGEEGAELPLERGPGVGPVAGPRTFTATSGGGLPAAEEGRVETAGRERPSRSHRFPAGARAGSDGGPRRRRRAGGRSPGPPGGAPSGPIAGSRSHRSDRNGSSPTVDAERRNGPWRNRGRKALRITPRGARPLRAGTSPEVPARKLRTNSICSSVSGDSPVAPERSSAITSMKLSGVARPRRTRYTPTTVPVRPRPPQQ